MKERIVNVDYYDLVLGASSLYDETRIDALFAQCAAHGVTTVLWRLSICGVAAWRSRVRAWYTGKYVKSPNAYNMVRVLKSFDPPEAACRLGRKHGLKVFAWVTVMDEDALPGLISDFVLEHPEYTWRSRDQRRYLRGALCYAYPEVREYRMREIREVLGYGFDGMYLCTRSHARFGNESRDLDDFGYNAPIVEEFRRRHGVDVLREDFDKLAYYDLQGEPFTAFLREASAAVHARGIPLWAGIHSDGYSMMNISPMGHMKLDYGTWSRDGLIDGLVVGGGEPILDQNELWFRRVEAQYAEVRRRMPLIAWFRLWDWRNELPWYYGADKETKSPDLIEAVARKYAPRFDGYAYHEALNIEQYDLWDRLATG